MPDAIAIAGAGRVGQALGRLLRERGETLAAIASRDLEHAARAAEFVGGVRPIGYSEVPRYAERVIIAVPDDAIGNVAGILARAGMRAGVALHTSGARGLDALVQLQDAGVECGSLHPLQTVANPDEGVRVLPGVAYAVDGATGALAWAEQLVAVLGGIVLRIPAESRALYHAAAVVSSNYLVALVSAAVMLMREAGVDEATARRALEPLARTSIENAFRLGPEQALTGPIMRGDSETVGNHLQMLAQLGASDAVLYRAAGLATLKIARRRGLGEDQAVAIEKLLRGKEDLFG